MASQKQSKSVGGVGAIGFAIAAACFVMLVTFLSLFAIPVLDPPIVAALANAGIAGFAVFLPYGFFYLYESGVAVGRLSELFQRIQDGDEEAKRRFVTLTHRMKLKWPDSGRALVERTLKIRAVFYFALAIALFVVIGVWIGQETVRQGGHFFWEWRAIVWRWP